jgi:hypothetical protein
VLILLLIARPALAGFEGYLEMNLTMKDGTGTMKGYVSGVGIRAEVEMHTPRLGNMPVHVTLLMKFNNPEMVYLLNDATHTYMEITPKEVPQAKQRPEKTYTVKKLGKEKILGYTCTHLLLTASDGGQADVWTTKELIDLRPFQTYMQHNRQSAEMVGVVKALQEADAEGFVAKMIAREPQASAPAFTLELVKAEKRFIAATQSDVPADYRKQAGLLGMMPGMLPIPPERQEMLQKALERLSPEQQKALEDLMRSRRGQ